MGRGGIVVSARAKDDDGPRYGAYRLRTCAQTMNMHPSLYLYIYIHVHVSIYMLSGV